MTVDRRRLLAGVPAAVVGSALFASAATAPEEAGSYDVVGMTCHGFAVTHLDALCHIFSPAGKDGMYNGYPINDVTERGAPKLGIEHVAAVGIVGRGVLLDIASCTVGRFRSARRLCLPTSRRPRKCMACRSARPTTCSCAAALAARTLIGLRRDCTRRARRGCMNGR